MAYVDGFVIPVPADKLDIYKDMARACQPIWAEYGAIGYAETVGDDVPYGEITSFPRAVQAEENEVIIFSWVAWPNRAHRDDANAKIQKDPRLKDMMENSPFNPKRMIFGGFEPFLGFTPSNKQEAGTAYVDGFVIPVSTDKLDDYKALATLCAQVWKDHGALKSVECVGDDVPYGTLTSFPRAVQAKDGESIIFSWIVYESRASRDAVMEKVMADPRMKSMMGSQPFDGKRMIFGGFQPFLGL